MISQDPTTLTYAAGADKVSGLPLFGRPHEQAPLLVRPTRNVRDAWLSLTWREKCVRGILLDLGKIAATLAARGSRRCSGGGAARVARRSLE